MLEKLELIITKGALAVLKIEQGHRLAIFGNKKLHHT